MGFFFYLRFPWAYNLVTRNQVLDVIEDLIGPNILCYQHGTWFKEPESNSYVSWHQDANYYGMDPWELLSAWVALTPVNDESPEIIAARKALEEAEKAKKSANNAKITADEAKKIADEAFAKAQRLSDEAKKLAGKKDSILDEALKAAKKAQEEAQEAKNFADQAAQDYQDALVIANEAQKLADAASGSEWDISGSLKARYENKLSNTAIDSVKTKSKIDFETESALAAREATDDYREKAKAIAAAAKTKELVRSAAIARGLSNSEASCADYIVKIPTSKYFSSINLSHSVIIFCYELFNICSKANFRNESKHKNITAKKQEVTKFINFILKCLYKIGFLQPHHKKQSMIDNIKNIFYRNNLSDKEIRILSSVFGSLYKRKIKKLN